MDEHLEDEVIEVVIFSEQEKIKQLLRDLPDSFMAEPSNKEQKNAIEDFAKLSADNKLKVFEEKYGIRFIRNKEPVVTDISKVSPMLLNEKGDDLSYQSKRSIYQFLDEITR